MRHVLLINSDRMEPVRQLAARPDLRLAVITKPKYAHLYEGIAEIWPVDDVANLMQARDAMLQMLRRHPVDAIITPIERSLLTGGFLRSYFALPGLSYDQMLGFANKYVMKSRLKGAGLPLAGFARLDRLDDLPAVAEQLGWPVVIKPAISSGTMNTFKIESVAQFAALRSAGQLRGLEQSEVPLLLEQYVAVEREYHCDGIVTQGQVGFASVSCYFQPLLRGLGACNGSYVLPAADPAVPHVLELHQAVVQALGLSTGVTHLEILQSASGAVVGEVTCRPGGAGVPHVIRQQFGLDLWDAFIRTAMGDVPQLNTQRTPGVVGWYGLPCRNGRIVAVTPRETLAQIPGVEDVVVYHRVGEHVQEKVTSVFNSAMLYFRLAQTDELPAFAAQVAEVYHIEVQ